MRLLLAKGKIRPKTHLKPRDFTAFTTPTPLPPRQLYSPPPPLPPVHSNNNRDQVNKHMTMLNNESNRHMPAHLYEERRDYVHGRSETHLLIPFTLDSG